MNAKKIITAIKKHSEFLVTSHVGLEGDALGSELALASLLKKLGKKAYVVNDGSIPANYAFLPGVKKALHLKDIARPGMRKGIFPAVFVLDCPHIDRVGNVARLIAKEAFIINIDHHIGNKNFGRINWVETASSSTGEMIFGLFALLRLRPDKNDALNIYTAMSTDTGFFRHSNTSSATLHIGAELLKLGVKPAEVYARIYENNSLRDMDYVAKIISGISFTANDRIASVVIKAHIFKDIGGKNEIFDKIFDFAKSINTVKAVVIFSEQDGGIIKVSMRSKSSVDVHKVALRFGGGGHKCASGCRIKGPLKEAQKKLLKQLKTAVGR